MPEPTTRSEFLLRLFEPMDQIEVRLLGGGDPKALWFDSPELAASVDWAESFVGRDVFFGANPRATGGQGFGCDEDVAECRILFADFDGTDGADAVNKAGLPAPAAIVKSGGGWHYYWRLLQAVDGPTFRHYQKRLARTVGSDPKVVNPSRIMRMPGTCNHKYDSLPLCQVMALTDNRWPLEKFDALLEPLPMPEAHEPHAGPPAGETYPLPRFVHQWRLGGCPEGQRADRAFSVACAMAGAGYPQGDAEKAVLEGAAICGLPEQEAYTAVKSAYRKPREPVIVPLDEDNLVAWDCPPGDQPPALGGGTRSPIDPPLPEQASDDYIQYGEPIFRPSKPRVVSNTSSVASSSGSGDLIRSYRPAMDVLASVNRATASDRGDDTAMGWPRRAAGLLFVPRSEPKPGDLPDSEAVYFLTDTDTLFAWMHDACHVSWFGGQVMLDGMADTGDAGDRLPMTKREFFKHVSNTAKPHYHGVEVLPHEPPNQNLWYAPCRLKPEPRGVLDEFVNELNFADDHDRGLMLAALLTPFWGGPCGARPAFVFTSDHGQGAGKTTTANLLAQVAGGAMEMGHSEKIDEFKARLLSDQALQRRVALLDNVKGKQGDSAVESLVTAAEISGKRMYVGHASRPNYMTWYITANAPALSRDMAERSFIIKMGEQKSSSDWLERTQAFVHDNRARLVSACLTMLAEGERVKLFSDEMDRWATWEKGVLSLLPNAAEIVQENKKRRGLVDMDGDQAEDIAAVIRGLITHTRGVTSGVVFLSRRAIADAWNQANPTEMMGNRKFVSHLSNRLTTPALRMLEQTAVRGERGYRWFGGNSRTFTNYDHKIMACPTDFAAEHMDYGGEHDEIF